jgi:hypothetical protein
VVVMAPVEWEPLVESTPDQAPEAVQVEALTAFQLRVVEPPEVTVLGWALSEMPGAALTTVTVAVCKAEPAGPMQVRSKSVVLVSGPTICVPLVPCVPVQPPVAVQKLVLVELHVSVAEPPGLTVEGSTVSPAVGAASTTATKTDSDVEPPGPSHAML